MGGRVCPLPFGNSVIHIIDQWSQPLLSIHEDIFNPTNFFFFFPCTELLTELGKNIVVSNVLSAHE